MAKKLIAASRDEMIEEVHFRIPREGIPGVLPRSLIKDKKSIFGLRVASRNWYKKAKKTITYRGWKKLGALPGVVRSLSSMTCPSSSARRPTSMTANRSLSRRHEGKFNTHRRGEEHSHEPRRIARIGSSRVSPAHRI